MGALFPTCPFTSEKRKNRPRGPAKAQHLGCCSATELRAPPPPRQHTSFSSLPNITISSTAGSLILLIPQVPCDPPVQCGCFPTAVPCDPHAGAPCLCLTMSSLKSWLLTVGPLDLPDVSPGLPDGETSPTIQSCLLMLASLLLLPRSKV